MSHLVSQRARGFSLLEMSIVLLILAVLAGMFLTFQLSVINDERKDTTEERMAAIQESIVKYRRVNKRIPCPADGSLTLASANFGRQAAVAGACTGTPAANFRAGNIAIGTVPTKTLGLSDDYMYDGWGRKLTYAVDIRATSACAAITYPMSDSTVGLTVADEAGASRTTLAWYVMVSHGPNGHGAFMPSGERMSAGSTNANERDNCHCDSSAALEAPLTDAFVQRYATDDTADPRNRFDDLVVFANREHIRSVQDENGGVETCP